MPWSPGARNRSCWPCPASFSHWSCSPSTSSATASTTPSTPAAGGRSRCWVAPSSGAAIDWANADDPRAPQVAGWRRKETSPIPGKEHPPVGRGSASEALVDTAISIDEIVDRHYGEWVLMRITEHDDEGW